MELNEAQQQAVNLVDGQLVIVACPGSGKTTTLLNRIYHMTNELNIDPKSIMLVTFSKEATREMKDRYNKYPNAKEVYFGTIHAFCLGLIKKFSPAKFGTGVVSEKESIDYFMNFPNIDSSVGNKYDFIKDLLLDIGNLKNSQESIEAFSPRCLKDKSMFLQFFKEYEDFKHRLNKIDYDDMMLIAYEMLIDNREVLAFVRNRYQYVMVDEYQDREKFEICLDYHVNSREVRNTLYDTNLAPEEFHDRLRNIIEPVYKSAQMCGFSEWVH